MKLLKIINIFKRNENGETKTSVTLRVEETFECLHVNKFTLNYFPSHREAERSIIMQPNIFRKQTNYFHTKENNAVRRAATVTKSWIIFLELQKNDANENS